MKRILFFTFLICVMWDFSQAQLENFNLAGYKLPEIKRKQLDLNVDFTESSENIKTKNEVLDNSVSHQHLSNSTALTYRSFVNTPKYQGQQYFFIGLSPDFERNKNAGGNLEKSRDLSTGFSINSVNRFYFRDRYFFEADINNYGNFSISRYDDENSVINEEDYNFYVSVPLMIGIGRIEPVQDARLAIYIFDELQKQGRITRIPSNEEIIEFSNLISKLKNARYFDYRLRRIAEIEQVDSFLQTRGLVTQPDVAYFTTVYDNWEYSAGPNRESGIRFSVGINPILFRNRMYRRSTFEAPPTVSKSDSRYHDNKMQIVAGMIKETPLNLYWQQSIGASASYDFHTYTMNNVVSETEFEYKGNIINAFAHYKLAYYPNSRTDLSARLFFNAEYEKLNYKSQPIQDKKRIQLFPAFVFDLNYYISPQLRLHVDFSADYSSLNEKSRFYPETEYDKYEVKRFNQELSATFIYSIF